MDIAEGPPQGASSGSGVNPLTPVSEVNENWMSAAIEQSEGNFFFIFFFIIYFILIIIFYIL